MPSRKRRSAPVTRRHEPILSPKGRPHPSGRPKHAVKYGASSMWRMPPDGPLTPGLARKELSSAIGFHVDVQDDDYE